jgi:hypothetical protein
MIKPKDKLIRELLKEAIYVSRHIPCRMPEPVISFQKSSAISLTFLLFPQLRSLTTFQKLHGIDVSYIHISTIRLYVHNSGAFCYMNHISNDSHNNTDEYKNKYEGQIFITELYCRI